MARVTVVGDPDCDAVFPDQFPSVLRVRTADGSRLEERVMVNRGGPGRPLSDDELRTKFRDNLARGLDPALAPAVEAAVDGLAGVDAAGVRALMGLVRAG